MLNNLTSTKTVYVQHTRKGWDERALLRLAGYNDLVNRGMALCSRHMPRSLLEVSHSPLRTRVLTLKFVPSGF